MITRRSILKSILALPMVARLAAPKPPAVSIDPTLPPPPMRNIAVTHEYDGPPDDSTYTESDFLNFSDINFRKGDLVVVKPSTVSGYGAAEWVAWPYQAPLRPSSTGRYVIALEDVEVGARGRCDATVYVNVSP